MKTLYYVIERQLDDVGNEVLGSNGWKTITVYEIRDNQPKNFCEIECGRSSDSVEEIQFWLDNNGYSDEEFNFQQL